MTGFANRISPLVFGASLVAYAFAQSGALSQARLPLPEASFSGVREGRALYARICAGCHLPDGSGAIGAGRYPPLARNSKLEHAQYPIEIVLEGRGAMPPFKDILDDAQIAAVLNYVRGPDLENNYAASIDAADVHRSRH